MKKNLLELIQERNDRLAAQRAEHQARVGRMSPHQRRWPGLWEDNFRDEDEYLEDNELLERAHSVLAAAVEKKTGKRPVAPTLGAGGDIIDLNERLERAVLDLKNQLGPAGIAALGAPEQFTFSADNIGVAPFAKAFAGPRLSPAATAKPSPAPGASGKTWTDEARKVIAARPPAVK